MDLHWRPIRQRITFKILLLTYQAYHNIAPDHLLVECVECVSKNNFNTTSVNDGHIGDAEIANHFQDKFKNLCNSVPTADRKLDELAERINHKIAILCNSSVKDNNLHCHISLVRMMSVWQSKN